MPATPKHSAALEDLEKLQAELKSTRRAVAALNVRVDNIVARLKSHLLIDVESD